MAGLDLERIAAVALAVADQTGPDGFTVRAVADALDVTPMALYHHVANKAALVALVVEEAVRELPLPVPTEQDWKDNLWVLAQWVRESMRAHPSVTILRMKYRAWTPSVLALGEHWMGLWQQSGLALPAASHAAIASSMAVVGMVHEEMTLRDFDPPEDSQLNWHPSLRSLFGSTVDQDAYFEAVVRSVIEGVHTRFSLRPADAL